MSKHTIPFWLSCLTLITPASVIAHEVQTHQRIGDVAVAYLQQSPQYQNRPLLSSLTALLEGGAVQEDLDPLPGTPYPVVGRYYFHFHPFLNFSLPAAGIAISGNCPSDEWGLADNPPCNTTCVIPGLCSLVSVPATNNNRWSQDLAADPTGAPSQSSIAGVSYVVHLLEDLGSPPHTRNDLHACPVGILIYCDPFEKDNDAFAGGNVLYGLRGIPNISVALALPAGADAMIPTGTFTSPQDFFIFLQSYISSNYYSNNTAFQGGPCPTTGCVGAGNVPLEDLQYLYAPCIYNPSQSFNLSQAAGTCNGIIFGQTLQDVRKVASKGFRYWKSCALVMLGNGGNEQACDKTKAEIDQTIALEQFAEIGPVLVQHVAAFIQFYAPALSVTVQGTGTVTSSPGTGINCTSGATNGCSALFVQGAQGAPQITLTAVPGVTWGGDCASAGTSATATVALTADMNCTATFSATGCPTNTICGIVTDYETGTIPLTNILVEVSTLTGQVVRDVRSDANGKYSAGSLTASQYFVYVYPGQGSFSPQGLFTKGAPGGVPVNFQLAGVSASVTVTGPSGALILFTAQSYTGPPPCYGAPGCQPFLADGVAPFTFSIPNGTPWMTCYVPPSYSQTSNQQLALKPQQSVTLACPQ